MKDREFELLQRLKNEPYYMTKNNIQNPVSNISLITDEMSILNNSEDFNNEYKITLKARVESCLEKIEQNPNNKNNCNELTDLIEGSDLNIFEGDFKRTFANKWADIIINLNGFDTENLEENTFELYKAFSIALEETTMQEVIENTETLKLVLARTIEILDRVVEEYAAQGGALVSYSCEFINKFPMDLIENKKDLCCELLEILAKSRGCLAEFADEIYEKTTDLLINIEPITENIEQITEILDRVEDPNPNNPYVHIEGLAGLHDTVNNLIDWQAPD